MAYQNVGRPRFYIDSGLYQQAIGEYNFSVYSYAPLLNLNPIAIYPIATEKATTKTIIIVSKIYLCPTYIKTFSIA